MKRKYKVGSKVRIIWNKTGYTTTSNYMDIGEIKSYRIARDGTLLVELYNFHKHEKHHSLGFPVDSIHLLEGVIEDGDTL